MATTTCQQCGAEIDQNAAFCGRCGGPVAPGTPPPPPDAGWSGGEQQAWGSPTPPPLPPGAASGVSKDDQNLGMLAHLSALVALVGVPSFVGPLIMYFVKREDPYVGAHATEALNFQISVLIYSVVGAIVAMVIALVTVGFGLIVIVPVAIGLAIAWLVIVVQAGLAASRGEQYRYPVTIRLVK